MAFVLSIILVAVEGRGSFHSAQFPLLGKTEARASPGARFDLLSASGSWADTSDAVTFSRQQAFDLWSGSVSSNSPNCMKSTVDAAKFLSATFCYYNPKAAIDSVTDYGSYGGLNMESLANFSAAQLSQAGDPAQQITVFGSSDTYMTSNMVWGSPSGKYYSSAQGWMLFPLSPLVSNASMPYVLLQIEGSFSLGNPQIPRNPTVVEWAIIFSQDNSNANYQVLDSGYFTVNNSAIQLNANDPSSKNMISGPLVVENFQPGQDVVLMVLLDDQGNQPQGSELILIDDFTFRFIGNCELTCDNGVADLKACVCQCTPYTSWTGEFCEVCGLNCQNGGSPQTSCVACSCVPPWGGTTCSQCDLPCINGKLAPAPCSCSCYGSWTGASCDVCNTTCQNGGTVDKSTCQCDCPSKWTGSHCEVCNLQCMNGGVLNSTTCTCSCPDPWEGETCTSCDLACYHGSSITPLCTCSPCQTPWGGEACDQCMLNCLNGGTLLDSKLHGEPCACECNDPWSGNICQTCDISCNPASSVSSTPLANCSCQCLNYWQGRFCDYCPLTGNVLHGGVSNDVSCTTLCPPLWAGEYCQTCVIQCQNGGIALLPSSTNPNQCACQCQPGYSGQFCEQCSQATCGLYSPYAGQPAMNYQCDCRQNGQCTNLASSTDRYCNTCSLSCITGPVPTHQEAPWPVAMVGQQQCFCQCGDPNIKGNNCELDLRNKVVSTNGRNVIASQSPTLLTYSTCVSCDMCWLDQQQCVQTGSEWPCNYYWTCVQYWIFGICINWQWLPHGTCNNYNPCGETTTVRYYNNHLCGLGETRCQNPLPGTGCCMYYNYQSSPAFSGSPSPSSTPCPSNADTYPAIGAIDGACSVTGNAAQPWLMIDLAQPFLINQVSVYRGNDEGQLGTANVYLSTSGNIASATFLCGTITSTGQAVLNCPTTNTLFRYVWVVGQGNGYIRVCNVQAQYAIN